jgi:hypothetical protein
MTAIPDASFLNAAMVGNPGYLAWPAWFDSHMSHDLTARPKVVDKSWQALRLFLEFRLIDFMRMNPKGEFYFKRVLQDDLTERTIPRASLDAILVLIHVADAIAVGLSIAKALSWEDKTRLGFAFVGKNCTAGS